MYFTVGSRKYVYKWLRQAPEIQSWNKAALGTLVGRTPGSMGMLRSWAGPGARQPGFLWPLPASPPSMPVHFSAYLLPSLPLPLKEEICWSNY
jgi:hypothetical protein